MVSTTIVGAVLIGTLACVGGILFVGPIGRLVFAQSSYGLYLIIVFASLPLGFALEAEFVWLRVANLPGMFARASLLRVGVTVLGNAPFSTPGRGRRPRSMKKGDSINGYVLRDIAANRIVLPLPVGPEIITRPLSRRASFLHISGN